MRKKVTWEDWKVATRWRNKSNTEMLQLWGELSSARRHQGIVLMREIHQKMQEEFSGQYITIGVTDEEYDRGFEKYQKALEKEGVVVEICSRAWSHQFDEDERIVLGKAKGDPPPWPGSPNFYKFLDSLNENSKKAGKWVIDVLIHEHEAEYQPLLKEWADCLDQRKEFANEKEKKLNDLHKNRVRAEKKYRQLWEAAKLSERESLSLLSSVDDSEHNAPILQKFCEARDRIKKREQDEAKEFGAESNYGNIVGDDIWLRWANKLRKQNPNDSDRAIAKNIKKEHGDSVSIGIEALRKRIKLWVQRGQLAASNAKAGRPAKA